MGLLEKETDLKGFQKKNKKTGGAQGERSGRTANAKLEGKKNKTREEDDEVGPK